MPALVDYSSLLRSSFVGVVKQNLPMALRTRFRLPVVNVMWSNLNV